MHVQQILKEYLELHGYWVLFIETFLEGEAILLLAGFLAFEGYLNILGVICTAWAGSFIGYQFYFYLGRFKGRWLLKRFHSIARKFREALKLIEKYGNSVAFISRFTYGFRIVLPIILGITKLAPRTFLWINLASALTWAVVFSLGGTCSAKALRSYWTTSAAMNITLSWPCLASSLWRGAFMPITSGSSKSLSETGWHGCGPHILYERQYLEQRHSNHSG